MKTRRKLRRNNDENIKKTVLLYDNIRITKQVYQKAKNNNEKKTTQLQKMYEHMKLNLNKTDKSRTVHKEHGRNSHQRFTFTTSA